MLCVINMSRPYTLYYSKRCQYCKMLHSQLAGFPKVHQMFQYIEAESLQKRGVGMSVPSIVYNNQYFTGSDAFRLVRSLTVQPPGPQCYDITGSDLASVEYSEIDGPSQGTTSRAKQWSDIQDMSASAV